MINLRKEMDALIGNTYDHVIVRHLTSDQCPCTKLRGTTSVGDPMCPNCEGAGWFFDENIFQCKIFYTPTLVAHSQDFTYGVSYSNMIVVYFPFAEFALQNIKIDDMIYQIRTHEDGEVILPIERQRKWLISDVYEMHEMDGQYEFLKIYAKPETV